MLLSGSLTISIAKAEAPVEEKIYPTGILEYKYYAYNLVNETWNTTQWKYFDDLIQRESSWNNQAQNPTSTAYGLGQFLDSTWETVECEKTSNPDVQIECAIKYLKDRYGTPQRAIMFHNKNNWY